MPERINAVKTSFFGKGAVRLLIPELQKMGVRRAFLITDSFLFESGAAEKVGCVLSEAGVEYAVYYHVTPNPTVSLVYECMQAARQIGAQLLVALGGRYNLAHGVCNAVLLPYVLTFVSREGGGAVQAGFAEIAAALGLAQTDAQAVIREVRRLGAAVGIAASLRELKGVDAADFPELAKTAMRDRCMATSPVKPDVRQVAEVYRRAFDGAL